MPSRSSTLVTAVRALLATLLLAFAGTAVAAPVEALPSVELHAVSATAVAKASETAAPAKAAAKTKAKAGGKHHHRKKHAKAKHGHGKAHPKKKSAGRRLYLKHRALLR